MNLSERSRTSCEAEREEISEDCRTAHRRDGKPLMVMVATTLAATALVLGMMWMSNTRYEDTSYRTTAEQQ
jgi:hypothetical protein